MSSSEEEGEIVSDCVTQYYFVDSQEEAISFLTLPLQWNDRESEIYSEQKLEENQHVFLRGIVDDKCDRQIYKKAVAWKFELSYAVPEIYVLCDGHGGRWLKLHSPRKSYEETVRTVLIAVHCLHYMKKNSEEVSEDALWKYIRDILSVFEVVPSADDLVVHLTWINEAASRDKDISKAKDVLTFISEVSEKRKALPEEDRAAKKVKFIDDDDVLKCDGLDDGDDDYKDELFDRVCAFCDDGGVILGCDGRCIRSFHPTIESGEGSSCESLGYSKKQVEALQSFMCPNCQYQRHQCFLCGRLGSSDKSLGAEVFPCVSATCGHFYHATCVSKRVFPGDDNLAQELQKQIEGGDSFTCPAHKCSVCNQGEDKSDHDMQFAVCRRCPKTYHRKCLPRNISFTLDEAKGLPQRAWEGLLIKRILIYCTDHKICRSLLTPRRDHLLFPDVCGKNKLCSSEFLPDKVNSVSERRSKTFGSLKQTYEVNKPSKNLNGSFKVNSAGSLSGKPGTLHKMEKSKLRWRDDPSVSVQRMHKSIAPFGTGSAKPLKNGEMKSLTIEMKKSILQLMENSTSSFNEEEFLAKKRKRCNATCNTNFLLAKSITMGRVEGSVKAVEAALKKLEEGGSLQDAKAVCEPGVLTQITKWKNKLAVYLAPFIHGKRYSSFGRHFTKVDKLKEVVDRLCWYVQDGDTVVDFCCGSNDFSCLMKEKLENMGRKCSFKNFDLIQPKNDFNFEKRDWMSVGLEELPEGSNLIMGLNPPFGVQAFHANQFIDKALSFRPKLLILIVPKETHRLDRKHFPYDLIWEDDRVLSGKSFYLPGSVDVNGKQLEQWNLDAPPLYLWSRPDWTYTHRAVAIQQGHIIVIDQIAPNQEMIISPGSVSNYLMDEKHGDYSNGGNINHILDGLPEASEYRVRI